MAFGDRGDTVEGEGHAGPQVLGAIGDAGAPLEESDRERVTRSWYIASVTRTPSWIGSNVYVHVDPARPGTSNAKRCPRSATVTVGFVDHRSDPSRLVPLKRAPTAGPVASPNHTAPVFSGLYSPIRVTSLSRSYTTSAGAPTSLVTDTAIGAGLLITHLLSVTHPAPVARCRPS